MITYTYEPGYRSCNRHIPRIELGGIELVGIAVGCLEASGGKVRSIAEVSTVEQYRDLEQRRSDHRRIEQRHGRTGDECGYVRKSEGRTLHARRMDDSVGSCLL